jgi:hypothetical protein
MGADNGKIISAAGLKAGTEGTGARQVVPIRTTIADRSGDPSISDAFREGEKPFNLSSMFPDIFTRQARERSRRYADRIVTISLPRYPINADRLDNAPEP